MTIDEAIVHAREVAESRDDMCAECREEHKQLADWLEELKAYKELDLEISQHFTKEQSMWIKKYCIERNKEFYNKGIDDFEYACVQMIKEEQDTRYGYLDGMDIREIAKKLKVGESNE